MTTFPESIRFSKPWRPYQKRVLDELEEHLDDNHLHVIAAPGSGKTVLGLEVMRRLNRPALVFAPSLAIRDQWADRFVHLFCESFENARELISRNLERPGLVTVSTYQGLHSAFSGTVEPEEDEDEGEADEHDAIDEADDHEPGRVSCEALIQKLKEAGIRTIIVDEAHHLRSAWWKCLIDLKGKLENPTVVSLTATPPFDVSPLEWERYKRLCGPVDSEISVPELVREKNLCPHQDYVYFSTPPEEERDAIKTFRNRVETFRRDLLSDGAFLRIVTGNPLLDNPGRNVEAILSDPAFYSSIAVFLKRVGVTPPKPLLKILGVREKQLPDFGLEILEILLTGCFFTHRQEFPGSEERFGQLLKSLKRFGAVERKKVILRNPKNIARLLASSISKLESIARIVQTENDSLRNDLRMVVLTDYIRKADFPGAKDDIQPLQRIGVVPIFEKIRRAKIKGVRPGILSGSLVVIPVSAKNRLMETASAAGVDPASLRLTPLPHDEGFLCVDVPAADRHRVVTLVTRLFNRGGITVLVGTKSLLGEGWDAPSINALVLASFVGSYMLSNQMRGRAIRTQHGNPHKTSNIWHLVCVEPGQEIANHDLEMLSRRFKAFVGVSFKEPVIENGVERLDIGAPPFSSFMIQSINARMKQRALDRGGLKQAWSDILARGDAAVRMVEEVRTTPASLPRGFVFHNTIFALFWEGVFAGASVFSFIMRSVRYQGDGDVPIARLLMIPVAAFAVGALVALPFCIKALYLLARHGPVSSSVRQIGIALVRALHQADLIQTPISRLRVESDRGRYGSVRCSLAGGTTYEQSLFLDALQEILAPIENPRYLLVRKTLLGRFLRKDYHVVPRELARRKQYALYFLKMWSRYVGPAHLVYTRTIEGRTLLLKARANALSTAFQKKSDRAKIWK